MCYQLFEIPLEQQIRLSSKEVIFNDDLKEIFSDFSRGKIKKVKVGKLCILNEFFIKLQTSGLGKYEDCYVFFGLEKYKKSFFSKASYRMFIWPLNSNVVFAVPFESVSFNKPNNDSKQVALLREQGEEHVVCRQSYDGKEHICIFEKMYLFREFAVERKKVTAVKDLVVHHFRWTDPDRWVRENFTLERVKEPMFFLRNDPEEISGSSVEFSYPRRPDLWGYDIDEN